MKKVLFVMAALLMCMLPMKGQVNQIVGDWVTVDDKTGQDMSVVHIYKATDGLYYGKIIELLQGNPDEVCVACEGADKGKKVVGLVIIRGFKAEDGKLVGGRVLDPDNGKHYYGKISLKDGQLVLRGSLDKKGLLGRSQTWHKK